jgi:hypothetical protein
MSDFSFLIETKKNGTSKNMTIHLSRRTHIINIARWIWRLRNLLYNGYAGDRWTRGGGFHGRKYCCLGNRPFYMSLEEDKSRRDCVGVESSHYDQEGEQEGRSLRSTKKLFNNNRCAGIIIRMYIIVRPLRLFIWCFWRKDGDT